MLDLFDFSLKKYNTFGIEAKCRRFIEFENVAELQQALSTLTPNDKPLLTIGGGSNLLLTDNFKGTVLHSAIKCREITSGGDSILLRCGSGEKWDDIVAFCITKGWHGAENLSFIPGDVGASAVQNIGAYGAEVKDIIYKVEAVEISTGKLFEFSNADCNYSYRQSRFKGEWKDRFVITFVTYKLQKTFTPHLCYGNILCELERRNITKPTAKQLREVIIAIRKAKLPDPEVIGNAGSFFMNPVVTKEKYEKIAAQYDNVPHYTIDNNHEKIPAGWMIDKCGWKGKTLGRAGVHSQQALVLVNRGGATGQDILRLCETIRKNVSETFGIDIKPEVNII